MWREPTALSRGSSDQRCSGLGSGREKNAQNPVVSSNSVVFQQHLVKKPLVEGMIETLLIASQRLSS
jgi:hypothetical protein